MMVARVCLGIVAGKVFDDAANEVLGAVVAGVVVITLLPVLLRVSGRRNPNIDQHWRRGKRSQAPPPALATRMRAARNTLHLLE